MYARRPLKGRGTSRDLVACSSLSRPAISLFTLISARPPERMNLSLLFARPPSNIYDSAGPPLIFAPFHFGAPMTLTNRRRGLQFRGRIIGNDLGIVVLRSVLGKV